VYPRSAYPLRGHTCALYAAHLPPVLSACGLRSHVHSPSVYLPANTIYEDRSVRYRKGGSHGSVPSTQRICHLCSRSAGCAAACTLTLRAAQPPALSVCASATCIFYAAHRPLPACGPRILPAQLSRPWRDVRDVRAERRDVAPVSAVFRSPSIPRSAHPSCSAVAPLALSVCSSSSPPVLTLQYLLLVLSVCASSAPLALPVCGPRIPPAQRSRRPHTRTILPSAYLQLALSVRVSSTCTLPLRIFCATRTDAPAFPYHNSLGFEVHSAKTAPMRTSGQGGGQPRGGGATTDECPKGRNSCSVSAVACRL
jgi:hypothetical protein